MSLNNLEFSKKLLTWFDKSGRHDLPWQQDINAYRVWVSETMLQQTQVATVIPYFQRFMESFPTVISLANAKEDAVLHLWTGLGYYARARNLHRAAKIIRDDYDGKFPTCFEDIGNLPGIGRSTAGAISAIALQQHKAILDGNVRRVLCRLFAIEGSPSEKSVQEKLWALAEQLTPKKRVADYTQAIMDLGATVCTRSKPNCSVCPFNLECLAYQKNRTAELPHRKPSKILPIKKTNLLILINSERQVLLEKRPNYGIWGGLWSLPECKLEEDVKIWCEDKFACEVLNITPQNQFRHTFSHYHLDITPIILQVESSHNMLMEADVSMWYSLIKPEALGLPAPIKKLLEGI